MEILSIENVFIDGNEEVTLKLAPAGLAMKVKSTSAVITLKKEDIREIEFFRSTMKFNMRIHCTNDILMNLNNIPETSIESIKDCCTKHYNINVYTKELEIQSVNRGRLGISGDFLEFKSPSKLIFDVKLDEIENFHEMKNELTFSFKESNNDVIEIRFTTENENIGEEIKERIAQLNGTIQKEIITFETLQSLVPRGKNDYIFYSNLFKMVGGTYEHKILYSSIKNIFVLEKEPKEFYLAIQIDPPIRQGQTRYDFIVMLFSADVEEDFELNISVEDRQKYPQLKKNYSGPLGETFVGVLSSVVDPKKEIIRTGDFQTVIGSRKMLRCSLKAFDGHLYPLRKGLLFLPKAIYMPINEINSVEFFRVNVSSFTAKTFDMRITTMDKCFQFNTIPKEDFGQLEQYFSANKIKVTSEIIDATENEEEESLIEESESDDILTESES